MEQSKGGPPQPSTESQAGPDMSRKRFSFADVDSGLDTIRKTKEAEEKSFLAEMAQKFKSEASRELEIRNVRGELEKIRQERWGNLGVIEPIENRRFGEPITTGYRLYYKPEKKIEVWGPVGEDDSELVHGNTDVQTSLRVEYQPDRGPDRPPVSIVITDGTDYELLDRMYRNSQKATDFEYNTTMLPVDNVTSDQAQHAFREELEAHLKLRGERQQTPQDINKFLDSPWINRIITKAYARRLFPEAPYKR